MGEEILTRFSFIQQFKIEKKIQINYISYRLVISDYNIVS